MIFSGFANLRSTGISTTTKVVIPLVFHGHSPVDMLVCYDGTNPSSGCSGDAIFQVGCTDEPCSGNTNGENNVLVPPGTTFSGPTGTGCNTESGTEEITIQNPLDGFYTLELFPSSTFFGGGPGCPGAPSGTITSSDPMFTYTIDIIYPNSLPGSNNQEMIGSISGPCSSPCGPLVPPSVGDLQNGQVTFTGFTPSPPTSGVPEFPLTLGMAIIMGFVALIAVRFLFAGPRLSGPGRKQMQR
jgi:hypothetical protein